MTDTPRSFGGLGARTVALIVVATLLGGLFLWAALSGAVF